MRAARLIIILTLLITFFVSIHAQNLNRSTDDATKTVNTAQIELGAQSPNELDGFKFFAEGKLNGLKLGYSTGKDIKEIFGTPRQVYFNSELYDYDSNWLIWFQYFDEKLTYLSTFSNQLGSIKIVCFPEYTGKLYTIKLFPKKTFSFNQTTFPSAFFKQTGIPVTTSSPENHFKYDLYRDAYGLNYSIINEPFKAKGDLLSIEYQIPYHLQNKIFDWKNPVQITRNAN
jgi:hypothetical protein